MHFAMRAEHREGRIGRAVDSGASCHLTSELSLFSTPLHPTSVHIGGITGGLTATGEGQGVVMVGGVKLKLHRLLYVPGLGTSLLSMSELVKI